MKTLYSNLIHLTNMLIIIFRSFKLKNKIFCFKKQEEKWQCSYCGSHVTGNVFCSECRELVIVNKKKKHIKKSYFFLSGQPPHLPLPPLFVDCPLRKKNFFAASLIYTSEKLLHFYWRLSKFVCRPSLAAAARKCFFLKISQCFSR